MDAIREGMLTGMAPIVGGSIGSMVPGVHPVAGYALGGLAGTGINMLSGDSPGVLPILGAAAGGMYGAREGWKRIPKLKALLTRNPRYAAALPLMGAAGAVGGAMGGGMVNSMFDNQQLGATLGGLGGLALALSRKGGIKGAGDFSAPILGAIAGGAGQKVLGL